jgi:hypothetical protein
MCHNGLQWRFVIRDIKIGPLHCNKITGTILKEPFHDQQTKERKKY